MEGEVLAAGPIVRLIIEGPVLRAPQESAVDGTLELLIHQQYHPICNLHKIYRPIELKRLPWLRN